MKTKNSKLNVFLVALMLPLLMACADNSGDSGATKEDAKVLASCAPKLSGNYKINGNPDLKDFKVGDSITIDGGSTEKPGNGFKGNWKSGNWKNVSSGGKCSIVGSLVFDGCTHDAKIQSNGKSGDKRKIKITLQGHKPSGSEACEAHKDKTKIHGHNGNFHGGSAHGKEG